MKKPRNVLVSSSPSSSSPSSITLAQLNELTTEGLIASLIEHGVELSDQTKGTLRTQAITGKVLLRMKKKDLKAAGITAACASCSGFLLVLLPGLVV